MSKFFDDTMQGLLQAIEIEKGNIPLTERKGMPAPTLLAKMTGNTQQAISRLEKRIIVHRYRHFVIYLMH